MIPFSVLDLVPIVQGGDAAQALANTLDLARHAERWGYYRYWLAEHHNMPGIASAATAVVIGHVAGGTSTLRVGAGGIMLPNHAPLVIAEQFGTLAALYPGRIDLGLGRAPGTDPLTMRALRRGLGKEPGGFASDVQELLHYFEPSAAGDAVQAVPAAGLRVPVWILGSSLFGAELAAALGLPFGFASHFAPAMLHAAIDLYRRRFQASERLERPYVMLGVHVFAADTDAEAAHWQSSLHQAFVHLRRGRPVPLPPPVPGFIERLQPPERAGLEEALSCSVVGSLPRVEQGLAEFIERTGADELILTSMIFDHQARLRSYELAAQAHAALAKRGVRAADADR
jgi:luciferase family oxidoreductase group 1